MTFIKLPQRQKTLAIALSVLGAYCNMPLIGINAQVQAQSLTSEVSTAKSSQTKSAPLKVLSPEGTVNAQLGTQHSGLSTQELAQTPESRSDRGAPSGRRDGGARAQADPPDRGAPGQRQDAGTRGGCPAVDRPLTALVPIVKRTADEDQSSNPKMTTWESVLGLTVAERPTFWFYVPYSLTPRQDIEFVLQDDKGNEVYRSLLTASDTSPGVVGFELPSTEAPLAVGKMYHWFFTIYCNPENREVHPFVHGWVQRVALNPSLKRQLAQATPQETVALYRANDIWYEAVTSLAKLRRKNPENAPHIDEWAKLLQSVNLEAIAQKPITSALTPKK